MFRALLCPVRLMSLLFVLLLLPWLIACGSSGSMNNASNAPAPSASNSRSGGSTGASGAGSNSQNPGTGTGGGSQSGSGGGTGDNSQRVLNPPRFMYVTGRGAIGSPDQNSTAISGFSIDPATGAVTRITDSGFSSSQNLPMGTLASPDGNALFLFTSIVGQAPGTDVVQFLGIDRATGKLSEFPKGKITANFQMRAAIHPSSRFLYLAYRNYNAPSIGAYGIDENGGTLTPIAGQPFAVQTPGQLVAEPGGNFLYIFSDHTIDAVRIDQQTGALSRVTGFPITVRPSQSSPGRLTLTLTGVIDPVGDFLFTLDTANSGVIWVYRIDKTTGALLLMPGSPFPARSAYGGQVDPTGRFLYLVDWYFDTIGEFAIDRSTGALTSIPGSPVQPPTWSPSGPSGGVVVADPSGKFLYFMDNVTQNSLTQLLGYSIDQSTGSLTALPSSPTSMDFSGDIVITH